MAANNARNAGVLQNLQKRGESGARFGEVLEDGPDESDNSEGNAQQQQDSYAAPNPTSQGAPTNKVVGSLFSGVEKSLADAATRV